MSNHRGAGHDFLALGPIQLSKYLPNDSSCYGIPGSCYRIAAAACVLSLYRRVDYRVSQITRPRSSNASSIQSGQNVRYSQSRRFPSITDRTPKKTELSLPSDVLCSIINIVHDQNNTKSNNWRSVATTAHTGVLLLYVRSSHSSTALQPHKARVAGKCANTGDARRHPQHPVSRRTKRPKEKPARGDSSSSETPALPRSQHSPIQKSVTSDTGTNSAVTLVEAAINSNETAVATELHFSAPTRPSRCSEHNHIAKYAPDERGA